MMKNNDNKNVKIAGIGYTVGNYLIRGIGFVTLPIFARLLSTADFGQYNTYTSYESIVFIIVGLSLHTSFKNAYYRFENKFEEYVSDCILIAGIFLLFLLFITNMFSIITDGRLNWYFSILLIHGFSTAIIADYNAYLGIYFLSKSYVKVASINALGNVTISLFLILTIFSKSKGFGRIIGVFIPTVMIAVYLVLKFWRMHTPNLSLTHIKFAFLYSLPLVPHGLSQVLLSSSDRIMISSMIGDSEAGLYSFAYTLVAIVSVTYGSLDQVWSPWLYQKLYSEDYTVIKKAANKYVCLMAIFTVGIMLIAPELTIALGSKVYGDSIQMIVPIMLGGFFSFLYSFPAAIEYYYEKTKYIAFGTILAATINVILNFICIKKFGYKAAAYTTLVTYFLYFLFHYIIAWCICKKKNLYDTHVFAAIIIGMFFSGVLCQISLSKPFIRWGIAMLMGIVLIASQMINIKKE